MSEEIEQYQSISAVNGDRASHTVRASFSMPQSRYCPKLRGHSYGEPRGPRITSRARSYYNPNACRMRTKSPLRCCSLFVDIAHAEYWPVGRSSATEAAVMLKSI